MKNSKHKTQPTSHQTFNPTSRAPNRTSPLCRHESTSSSPPRVPSPTAMMMEYHHRSAATPSRCLHSFRTITVSSPCLSEASSIRITVGALVGASSASRCVGSFMGLVRNSSQGLED
ncbi:hypothetical protein E2542_SST03321 [Spatholobus suberectus]|nr:hypothetical protein E2542_SST03321 [Spatholobus suberectus]